MVQENDPRLRGNTAAAGVDLNGDGFEDVMQSNDEGYAIYLWAGTVKARLGWSRGWPHLVAKGPAATDLGR